MANQEILLTDTFDEWRQKTNVLINNIGDVTKLSEYSVPDIDNLVEAINDLDERNTFFKSALRDGDQDTRIEVEKNSDEDKIRFTAGGKERIIVETNVVNVTNDTSSSGASINSAAQLNIDSGGDSGIQISSGSTNLGRILFGDSGSNNIGRIEYSHLTNSFNFIANNSANVVSITNAGKLQSTNLGNTDNLATTATNVTDAINEINTQVAAVSVIPFAIALG